MNLPYTMTPADAAEAVRAFTRRSSIRTTTAVRIRLSSAKALEGTGIDVRLRDWYASKLRHFGVRPALLGGGNAMRRYLSTLLLGVAMCAPV